MTTYTTCDNCASTLEVSNRVTVTMDWSNSYSAPSHDEYHFCQWPCLMTWLKKQQAKYGWKERVDIESETLEFRDGDVVEVMHGACGGVQGVLTVAPSNPVKRVDGNLVHVHWPSGHPRAEDSELVDVMVLKLIRRRQS